MDFLSRTEALLGREAMDRLKEAKVCVFGIGGVGSYALEALVRAGIGKLVLVDHAKVDMTNINRQIIALGSTVGIEKVKVAANRMLDINPNVQLSIYDAFASKKNVSDFIPADTDYIVDAIDSVTAKLDLIEFASKEGIPIISCMGTGNKLHPEKLGISDISKTHTDPLARIIRTELRKRGIDELKVVWSDEEPVISGEDFPTDSSGRKVPASISFVPSSAGLMMASVVVNYIASKA